MKVDELLKYKDSLYSALSRDLDAFEKNFILTSTGLLAFSITFIKDIVHIETAELLGLLFAGWLFILLSIGIMMFTFLTSVKGSNEIWKIVDDFQMSKNLYDRTADVAAADVPVIKAAIVGHFYPVKKTLHKLRMAAVFTFIAGLLGFSVFVCVNLYNESGKKPNQTPEKTSITIKMA